MVLIITAGVDVGSTTTKVMFLDSENEVRAMTIVLTGMIPVKTVAQSVDECSRQSGIKADEIGYCIATGYGRELVAMADEQVTEITCHAKGAHFLFPEARGVIDIGGQDSKAISIDGQGRVQIFAMNDKCAAGTGRFLDVMAQVMGIDVEEMGRLSLNAQNEVLVSSVCTVFAESEVISLISKGVDPADLASGIHHAVARRVYGLLGRSQIKEPIVMTGGVAKNVGVVRAFEEMLNTKLLIPDEPQIVGALGAAYLAREKYMKKRQTAGEK